jgi:hypothetical protein
MIEHVWIDQEGVDENVEAGDQSTEHPIGY